MKINKFQLLNPHSFKEIENLYPSKILRITSFQSFFENAEKPYLFSKIALPTLNDYKYELWTVEDNIIYEKIENFEVARSKDYCLIRLIVDELPVNKENNQQKSLLAQSAYEAYKNIFDFSKRHQLGNFVRFWNYVPRILELVENDSISLQDRERYRQFNIGRTDAWFDFGPRNEKNDLIRPAATGINAHNGPLVIEYLTSHLPIHYIENPRQKPAYEYPPDYGSRSPAFARATLLLNANHSEIYIAGTASVVGHQSVHIADPINQVRETFNNIHILIGSDNLSAYGCDGFSLDDLQAIRVYVKDPNYYSTIREETEKILGKDKPVIYIDTDICRKDLLLEIEAVATK